MATEPERQQPADDGHHDRLGAAVAEHEYRVHFNRAEVHCMTEWLDHERAESVYWSIAGFGGQEHDAAVERDDGHFVRGTPP